MSLEINGYEAWPLLPYQDFKATQYLLHRITQMIGKLKLTTPFELHWANVALWTTGRGLSTGAIPYKSGVFEVSLDFIEHKIIFNTSWGQTSEYALGSDSVASFYKTFLAHLNNVGIDLKLNPKPQEIPNAISFEVDQEQRPYDTQLVNAWWRILLSSYRVLEQYHARFAGISPAVGFMWGTFDLRDARYRNKSVPTPKMGLIERNAMDVHQVEAGWWAGSEQYPKPAYFSFTYPKPAGFELAKIAPDAAQWNNTLGEFILEYEQVKNATDPEAMLLAFFESAYQAGADLAGWDPTLIHLGKPI